MINTPGIHDNDEFLCITRRPRVGLLVWGRGVEDEEEAVLIRLVQVR